MSKVAAIASPCMNVCQLDPSGRICIGCLRTSEEIARWVSLTDAQRAQVIGALPERHRLLTGGKAELEPRTCSRCGTAFGCGANGDFGNCWCTRYPPVTPATGQTCLCPACLAAAAN
jgi:predicted Fe-S protein YdhL (DUF1289 family)